MTRMRRILCALLLGSAVTAAVPLAMASATAEEQVQGTLLIVHQDLGGGRSHDDFAIKTSSGIREIEIDEDEADDLVGRKVKLKGHHRDDGAFVVAAGADGAQATGGAVAAALPGQKTVAVLLMNFSNNTSQPWTTSQVRGVVFDNANSVAAYYSQASYGQISLVGDVYGWYTLSTTDAGCNWSGWGSEARTKATAAGVNLSNYQYVVYAFPSTSTCGWAGLGYLPGSGAWINGSMNLRVVGHELGHNLGVHHASTLRCSQGTATVTLSTTCSASEYGDPFTIMGASSTLLPHNWHRAQHGWLAGSDAVTVSTGGTFTLRPSEGTTGPRALRIARGDGTYYWLEYRHPSATFDTFAPTDPAVTGVTVRLVPDSTSIVQSKLLDMTPETSSFSDAPLATGKSYVDSTLGVTITTSAVSASGATVAVSFGGGTTPGDTQPPTAPPSLAGQALGQTSVGLSWAASTDNVGVTGYRISRNGTVLTTTTGLTYTDTGLAAGTSYTYSVVALDAATNQSLASNVTVATQSPTPTDTQAPTRPGSLAGQALSQTSIRLSWTASTDNTGVTGYRISRNGTVLTTTTSLTFTDSGLTPSTSYAYTVVALDAAGNQSQAASVTTSTQGTTDTTPPTAPSGLSARSPASRTVTLTWLASTDNVGVAGYRVYRNGTQVAQVTTLTYTEANLSWWQSYTYTVKAFDARGNLSASSASVSIRPAR